MWGPGAPTLTLPRIKLTFEKKHEKFEEEAEEKRS
jgi:hypothetical protein